MKIGVLAVQGAFIEHINMLENISKKRGINIETVELRHKEDLDGIDGIIFPGGESTVQGQLLRKLDMFDDIKNKIKNGLPVLATCAGLILLAEKIENDNLHHLGTIPVTVRRNAYGRQLGSFITNNSFSDIDNYPHVFIRAPYITKTAPDVKILSIVDNSIVGVEYGRQIAIAFHPELTSDSRIHEYFISKVINK